MKHYEAKDLIKDVFENSFDKNRYTWFIKNLLKDIEEKPFPKPYTGAYIPRAFNTYIQQLDRIGKFEDEEGNGIDILVVELKREHSIEYARSAQRNFVRWYLSGSRGGQMKDAALVAFHSAKSSEWRFSLIKMQYSLETKKDEFTPAKRFSFFVGEKGKSHTAQRQLVKLLKSDNIPLLSDLEESFSIESVTNEFFEKYKSLVFNLVESLEHILANYASVKNEFDAKKIDALDFSKKLMGQIVFIYFLQRKGWLGVQKGQEYGDGDRNFLRSLYNQKKAGENFFNDYLEHLFYDALNNNKRPTDFYPRFNCKIPFLNGGLFDPIGFYDWQKTNINLLDDIFTNDIKTKEGDSGSGILDIFDLYNFTVNEAEPLEKEVAVDPEMLGKVFERMLDVKERKSKGAFYTPREIVHYMSQESLIHYLDTALNVNVSYASSMGNSISMDVSSIRSNKKQDANNANDTFMYYDPNAPVYKKQRNLPHWQQEGTAYFVTFRLYDSIPKEAAEKIKKERDLWLQKNKISDSSEIKKLSKEEKIEYYKLFSKRYDELLDNGYGSCVLKEPECKELVENALKYFDGSRYQLDEYAIQPNHVHVVVIPKEDWTLSQITHSWKSYTSNEINKILGRKGTLWMVESFDHIIRSAAQFEKIREYIVAQASCLSLNPKQQQNSYFDQSDSHRQDACDTVPKEDIEKFIKQGEQLIEKDAAILEGRLKESANKYQIPESIRKHANLIDEKLRDIRVCDPAVGSGAFPVGVMNEIVKARSILFKMQNPGKEPSHYDFKNHAIHHCLYGVDIDASAVEICKLRLWLSLVVDEQRIDMIEPLPNLDYKIVRGNSLINMPDGVMRDQLLEKEIEQLMEKYYAETDKQAKRDLKDEIDSKIKQLLKSAEQFTNYPIDFDFKLFFHEVFKEKGGFDVVIGNPPYFNVQPNSLLRNTPNFKMLSNGVINSASLFINHGAKQSILVYSFIVPKSISFVESWRPIRQKILTDSSLLFAFDVGMAFENVGLEMIVLISSKQRVNDSSTKILHDLKINYSVKQSFFKSNDIILTTLNKEKLNLISKLQKDCFLLGYICEMPRGLTLNKKYFFNQIDKDKIQILGGTNIQKYLIKDGGKRKPNRFIEQNNQQYIKKKNLFSKNRIVYQNIASSVPKIVATIMENKLPTDDTINNLYLISKDFSLYQILGVLNSSLITFYLKNAVINNAILTVHLDKPYLGKLPIKKLLVNYKNEFDFFVKALLHNQNMDIVFYNYFYSIIDGMVFELYFEDEVKKAGRDIFKYLKGLTPITDDMSDEEKMQIITKTFNELYDKNHPVRQNLEGMDEIEEVKIIKGLDKIEGSS